MRFSPLFPSSKGFFFLSFSPPKSFYFYFCWGFFRKQGRLMTRFLLGWPIRRTLFLLPLIRPDPIRLRVPRRTERLRHVATRERRASLLISTLRLLIIFGGFRFHPKTSPSSIEWDHVGAIWVCSSSCEYISDFWRAFCVNQIFPLNTSFESAVAPLRLPSVIESLFEFCFLFVVVHVALNVHVLEWKFYSFILPNKNFVIIFDINYIIINLFKNYYNKNFLYNIII